MNINDIMNRYENGETLISLSKDNNCSVDKIRWILKKNNKWKPSKVVKYDLPEEDIITLYKKDVSIKDISIRYNVSVAPIVRILKKQKIIKPNWLKTLPYFIYEKVIDKDFFSTLVEEYVSQNNIMKKLGCGQDMVKSLCDYHNIILPHGAIQRSILNRKNADYLCTFDNFKKLYIENHLPLYEIARKFNISVSYLRKIIRDEWKYEYPFRKAHESRLSKKFLKYRDDVSYLKTLVEDKKMTLYEISMHLECCVDTIHKILKEHNINVPVKYVSRLENEISNFIENLGFIVERNRNDIIYPYEIDIYVPSRNLAIEYCGLYWHSEKNNKGKNYHLLKTEMCNIQGIRLLTIFEDEYINNKDIINSKISSILYSCNNEKINARECIVKEISAAEKNIFLNANHIQGEDKSKVKLGLFFYEHLVSVMTFSNPSRVRNSIESTKLKSMWELNRFATDITKNVRGAAGKLLSYFIKNYKWDYIYSYADRRWSNGDLYKKLGFKELSLTKPNYWYVSKGYRKREYRYKYAKYKLVKQGFDKHKSEREIMMERGFTRIWDCGHYKFELKNRGMV